MTKTETQYPWICTACNAEGVVGSKQWHYPNCPVTKTETQDWRKEFKDYFVADKILDCIPVKNWREMDFEVFGFIERLLTTRSAEVRKEERTRIAGEVGELNPVVIEIAEPPYRQDLVDKWEVIKLIKGEKGVGE